MSPGPAGSCLRVVLFKSVRRIVTDSYVEASALGTPEDVDEVGFVRDASHIARKQKRHPEGWRLICLRLVAGAGFEPATFGL